MNSISYINCYDYIKKSIDLSLLYKVIDSTGFTRTSSIHPELIAYLLSKSAKPFLFEVGTFEGFIPILISNLNPNAHVLTIDIPFDDPRNGGFYDINPIRKKKIVDNHRIINSRINSSSLLLSSQLLWKNHHPLSRQIDLAWIDGDHEGCTPYNDILFALHNLNPHGIILCDDVRPNLQSDPTLNAIKTLQHDFNIKINLIQKRKENSEKFILILRQINTLSTGPGLAFDMLIKAVSQDSIRILE